MKIQREEHIIDATGKILGRLSTEVATLLMGKHKPGWVPYLDMGDFVTVINVEKIRVTGKKELAKKYFRHSGYPGGLTIKNFDELMKKDSRKIIEHAVKGMVPKNKLGKAMIKKLKVYKGEINER